MLHCCPVKAGGGSSSSSSSDKDKASELSLQGPPRGEETLLKLYFESGVLRNEFLGTVLLVLALAKKKKILQPKEKECFSKFCLKLAVGFGCDVVRTEAGTGAEGQPWTRSLAATDCKKFFNSIKKLLK
jgi:hypothetical protein